MSLVIEVDDDVLDWLQVQAREQGVSVDEEATAIVRRHLARLGALDKLARIQARFGGKTFPDSSELIREDRDSR